MSMVEPVRFAPCPGTLYVVSIQGPAKWMNANDRMHYQDRKNRTRAWRDAAIVAGRQARLPMLEQAHVWAYVRFRDSRKHDAGNWYLTAKAAIDGLVEAGMLLPDDDDEHLRGPDMRPAPRRSPFPVLDLVIVDTSAGSWPEPGYPNAA